MRDGDTFKIGNIGFRAVHTPGHMVFPVKYDGGEADEPIALLSGDFLFVGGAARPDLLEQAAGLKGTLEAGAKALSHGLHRVSGLPRHVQGPVGARGG